MNIFCGGFLGSADICGKRKIADAVYDAEIDSLCPTSLLGGNFLLWDTEDLGCSQRVNIGSASECLNQRFIPGNVR